MKSLFRLEESLFQAVLEQLRKGKLQFSDYRYSLFFGWGGGGAGVYCVV